MIPEIIVTNIKLNLAKVNISNMGTYLIQEMAVMGYNNNSVLKACQEVLQPVNGSQIQMVGRLVQQQNIWIAKESLCQKYTHLQGRIQLRHLLVVVLLTNTQAIQQLGCIRLSIPAVQLSKFSLQLTSTDTIFITEIWLSINSILFVHNVYQMLITHNNSTKNLILIKGKVILLQHRHTLARSNINRSLGRLNITTQKLQKSRFTSTIGTNNAIAVARGKFDGYILKQDTFAKLQGYAAS